jgi:hypothetical protein
MRQVEFEHRVSLENICAYIAAAFFAPKSLSKHRIASLQLHDYDWATRR